jgi:hypothetical protein
MDRAFKTAHDCRVCRLRAAGKTFMCRDNDGTAVEMKLIRRSVYSFHRCLINDRHRLPPAMKFPLYLFWQSGFARVRNVPS